MDGDVSNNGKQQNVGGAESGFDVTNFDSGLQFQDAKTLENNEEKLNEAREQAAISKERLSQEQGDSGKLAKEEIQTNYKGSTKDSDLTICGDSNFITDKREEPTKSSCALPETNDSVAAKVNIKKDRETDKNEDGPHKTHKAVANLKEEKREEDVPEDFFDDFLKEDFMAGLDIVDEDDEEQEDKHRGDSKFKMCKKNSTETEESKSRDSRIPSKEKIDHVKKFKESPSGEVKKSVKKPKLKKRERNNELKKFNAEFEELKKNKSKKLGSGKSVVDADNFDIRRDPEKTRQAIQRDKIKTAKDKEKRLITDIVETGLVPPGMELEVDIEEVRRIEKNLPIGDLRERLGPQKTKSPERFKSSVKKRTPPRKRSHSASKRRKSRSSTKRDSAASTSVRLHVPGAETVLDNDERSVSHRSQERAVSKRSPLRRSPLSRRSPILRRSSLSRHSSTARRSPASLRSTLIHRSPILRRSPMHRVPLSKRRSPLLRRRSRSRGLTRRRSRSRSPVQQRRSRSRNRSPTYRRRRDLNYSPLERERRRRSRSPPWKEDKMSFLEELAVKLNETRPPQSTLPAPASVTYVLPTPLEPVVAPVPAPVPPPQSAFFSAPAVSQPQVIPTTSQQFDHYDQNFFIGTSAPLPEREQPHLIQQSTKRLQQFNGFPRNDNADLSSNRDMAKLFGDKRIKLSDFLAITAKPQANNSSPAKLQEKIKVIQRCQEAIKILNEKRFTGPLVVHKTDSYECSQDMTKSPLLRKPIRQLPFTTPGPRKSTEIDFSKCCETLLYRIGIDKTLAAHREPEKPKAVLPKEVPQKEIAPPVYPIIQNYFETRPIKAVTKTLSTQTDKELSSCKECLRRKGILYANCGVQAGNPTLTFSVSTQVTEADFYSMIPKTQSLASLTPAQLLGKQSMINDHSRGLRNVATQEMSRVNFQVPSPPPPPIFNYMLPQTTQRDAGPYHTPLFCQTSIPYSQNRSNFGDEKNTPAFPDNRRGGYSNRRF